MNLTLVKDLGTILIPNKIISKITLAHKLISNVEWNGVILYRTVDNVPIDITKPNHFIVEDLVIVNIGTSGAFDYVADESMNLVNSSPYILDCLQGLVHTHHNMGAFFSGTDMDEIAKSVDMNVYLSLVVDFKGAYVAKLLLVGEQNIKHVNELANTVIYSVGKGGLVQDLTVIFEDQEANTAQLSSVITKWKERPVTPAHRLPASTAWSYFPQQGKKYDQHFADDYFDDKWPQANTYVPASNAAPLITEDILIQLFLCDVDAETTNVSLVDCIEEIYSCLHQNTLNITELLTNYYTSIPTVLKKLNFHTSLEKKAALTTLNSKLSVYVKDYPFLKLIIKAFKKISDKA